MQYDFRKVQEQIALSGKTLREVEEMTGVCYTTISRALRTGRARQSTALKLTKTFRLSMKDIVIKRRGGIAA